MIGRTGRVTGRVAAGTTGEVAFAIRGGSETFHAFPSNGTDEFETGAKVQVVDFQPPNKVYVEAVPAE
jgi:hypothetical protein